MAENFLRECNDRQHGFSCLHFSGRINKSELHIDKDLFSVFMPLKGTITYDVEGKLIHIGAKDILLVGNNELHRCISDQDDLCEYILLMVDLDFFIKNNCTKFSDMVFNRSPGNNNVIPAETTEKFGIFDIFMRLDGYCNENPPELAVVNSVIIELLYHLNKHAVKSGKINYTRPKINSIIEYINENITEDLSLDKIAGKFFLTKQYLCKVFKKNTGYTVNKYISYRRIVFVRESYFNGMSLSEACYKAGFKDYSSFYRAYSKITNESPRKDLTNRY